MKPKLEVELEKLLLKLESLPGQSNERVREVIRDLKHILDFVLPNDLTR